MAPHYPLAACHLALALCLARFVSAEASTALYDARQTQCDWFVGPKGRDGHDGTSYQKPLKTLGCAIDPACNDGLQSGDVICLLAGVFKIEETAFSRLDPETELKIMALGEDYSAVLDGRGKVQILNVLQTSCTFQGIVFKDGSAEGSAGAVYGERALHFKNCKFIRNKASVHGGAIMGARLSTFRDCEFRENSAKFAGAVRVNDIGSATFTNCLFHGNFAELKGGAIITQIETPEQHYVRLTNVQFCFNSAPESDNIFNFRTSTHKCKQCKFNSRECCNGHGRVVPVNKCKCDEGWEGKYCDKESTDDTIHHHVDKTEGKGARHEEL